MASSLRLDVAGKWTAARSGLVAVLLLLVAASLISAAQALFYIDAVLANKYGTIMLIGRGGIADGCRRAAHEWPTSLVQSGLSNNTEAYCHPSMRLTASLH